MMRTLMVRGALAALVCTVSMCAYAMADTPRAIVVPPGDLAAALELVSRKTGVELVFNPQQIKGIRTKGVSGTLSSQDAVRKLLEGTRLELRTDSATGAMMIGSPQPTPSATANDHASDPTSKEAGKDPAPSFRVVQVDQAPVGPQVIDSNEQAQKKKDDLEEILVTGSRLPVSALGGVQQAQVYTAVQIEQSGQTTVTDFLNTL